jgi:hypothetical protein
MDQYVAWIIARVMRAESQPPRHPSGSADLPLTRVADLTKRRRETLNKDITIAGIDWMFN